MPFQLSKLKNDARSSIIRNWPDEWRPITKNSEKEVKAYADAFGDAFSDVLKQLVINGGLIAGGASPPGGPVAGAILSIPPGGIVSTKLNLERYFNPPNYETDDANGQPSPGKYTEWLRGQTELLDSVLGTQWDIWIKTWTLAAGSAIGGSAGWTPLTPGPWALGTIVPFTFMGEGSNASPALKSYPSLVETIGRTKRVSVKLDPDRSHPTSVVTNESKKRVSKLAKALVETMDTAMTQIMVKDPTGIGASGVASPPAGSVVGTISGLMLDVL
jgi:hypothetical protein